MKVFAISDLHISTFDKPMHVFGDNWLNHFEKIKTDWLSKVSEDDLILIAGDVSWAKDLDEAKQDYSLFIKLPGKKVICKGNHEYYWTSISKMRKEFPECYFIQNDAIKFGNVIICGTRGWDVPTKESKEEDIKIYERELKRLELSLNKAIELKESDEKIIVMTHFPPFNYPNTQSEFTAILELYGIDTVIYGHLHGTQIKTPKIVETEKVTYYLTACDQLDFNLINIC